MFKIECFCEDKRLPQVFLALQGLILAGPSVVPVVNAEAKNGKVIAQTGGNMAELFHQHVKRSKLKVIRAGDVKAFLKTIGRSPTSNQHCLRESLKAGWLRKRGKGSGTTYVVKS